MTTSPPVPLAVGQRKRPLESAPPGMSGSLAFLVFSFHPCSTLFSNLLRHCVCVVKDCEDAALTTKGGVPISQALTPSTPMAEVPSTAAAIPCVDMAIAPHAAGMSISLVAQEIPGAAAPDAALPEPPVVIVGPREVLAAEVMVDASLLLPLAPCLRALWAVSARGDQRVPCLATVTHRCFYLCLCGLCCLSHLV